MNHLAFEEWEAAEACQKKLFMSEASKRLAWILYPLHPAWSIPIHFHTKTVNINSRYLLIKRREDIVLWPLLRSCVSGAHAAYRGRWRRATSFRPARKKWKYNYLFYLLVNKSAQFSSLNKRNIFLSYLPIVIISRIREGNHEEKLWKKYSIYQENNALNLNYMLVKKYTQAYGSWW